MSIWLAAAFGGLGGSVRGFLALYNAIGAWHLERRQLRTEGTDRKPRPFCECADWAAESIALAAQILLGAITGVLLNETGTVAGVPGAILAGAAAPAILGQLGRLESVEGLVGGSDGTKQQRGAGDTLVGDVSGTPDPQSGEDKPPNDNVGLVATGDEEVEQEEEPRAN